MKEIMVEWEMLKIPRKELNKIMNSVNFTTDIENVTKNKKLFSSKLHYQGTFLIYTKLRI